MKKTLLAIILLIVAFLNLNAQPAPYVILVSFDGFRWDYVNRGITPNLDMMQENGAWALSLQPSFPSKTFPNHLAIITGMYPEHHGVIFNEFRDPFTCEIYAIGDTSEVRDSKWYLGEAFWETAERQGITTASYFWPGSELPDRYRHPTLHEAYEHERPYPQRVEGVLSWLQLPQNERPHFITLYFHDTDTFGHRFGPHSPEINESIQRLDGMIGLLYEGLDKIGMRDSVNVIVVSDHGMTEISIDRLIDIPALLKNYKCEYGGSAPVLMVDAAKDKEEEVFNILKQNENHYKVYYRKDVPEYFHFSDNPYIYDIVLIAETGWSLLGGEEYDHDKMKRIHGDHGFDNHQTDMHGIFIASGPSFKKNYSTGTLWNVDIYPLLCKIFNIFPSANIDGKLERIGFLLK